MLLNKKLATIGIGIALLAVADVSPAMGAVITSGTYTGTPGSGAISPGGDGYDFTSGPSTVSGGTFTGGTGGNSISPNGSGFSVGGNGGAGVSVFEAGATVVITGGSFTGGNGGNASGAGAGNNIAGDGGDALDVFFNGAATVSGGIFGGGVSGSPGNGSKGFSFESSTGGDLTLIGTFQNAPTSPITSGTGSFTGTLADNSTPATYTYLVSDGEIVLTSAGVPEPASLSLLAVGGVAVLGRRRRRGIA
jgi:hypothetical protein